MDIDLCFASRQVEIVESGSVKAEKCLFEFRGGARCAVDRYANRMTGCDVSQDFFCKRYPGLIIAILDRLQ